MLCKTSDRVQQKALQKGMKNAWEMKKISNPKCQRNPKPEV